MSAIMMHAGKAASGGGGGSPVITTDDSMLSPGVGYNMTETANITTIGGRTISSITLIAGSTGGYVTNGGTGGSSTTVTLTTPSSGIGTISGTYRIACSTGETVDVAWYGEWGT